MGDIAFKIIRVLVLGVLLLSFVFSLFVGIVTWKKPEIIQEFLTHLVPSPTQQPVKINGIAVLGDSQSDEYRADDNRGGEFFSTTLNWIELLEKKRNVNFGKWNTYEGIRRTGYEYNWARTGATVNSLLESGQHIEVAQQIKEGKVNVIVVYVGANDFAPYITHDGYEVIYDGSLTEAEVAKKVNRVVADITTALDVLQNAGKVHIILVKIPDWGRHIGVQIAFPFPTQRNRVTAAVENANQKLQVIADSRNIITVDPNEFYSKFLREGSTIHGTKMQLLLLNNDPKNIFLYDGIHLGTVLNGFFANEIIRTLNSNLQTNIREFSDEEILSNAGITIKK